MPAFLASALEHEQKLVLFVAPNWLGDSIMAMPGLQAFKEAQPETKLCLMVKPQQAELWRMAAVRLEKTLILEPGLSGVFRAAAEIRSLRPAAAFILPRSFRSALPPFLARVPKRVGLPGHARAAMLTRVVRPAAVPGREHQAYECLDLLGASPATLPMPRLAIPEEARRVARTLPGTGSLAPVILAPGARRGPSKQWPAAAFAKAGRLLGDAFRSPALVVGSQSEAGLCAEVAALAGNAFNLAGRTSLPELAALFESASVVLANDSGPMHLAAAAGAPVVAVFGLTDPTRTGPLGKKVAVLQDSAFRSRDVPRRSSAATEALARITPEQVFEVARELVLQNNARQTSGIRSGNNDLKPV